MSIEHGTVCRECWLEAKRLQKAREDIRPVMDIYRELIRRPAWCIRDVVRPSKHGIER